MNGIQHYLSPDKRILTIKAKGRFDFKQQRAFRQAYEQLAEKPQEYLVDFGEVDYIDSSGLGMLMVFHQLVSPDAQSIKIIHVKPEVRELLLLANLSQLFDIR